MSDTRIAILMLIVWMLSGVVFSYFHEHDCQAIDKAMTDE